MTPGHSHLDDPSQKDQNDDCRSVISELDIPKNEELRCIIAVMRHGDRTPKQKMKFKVSEQRYLDYFLSLAKGPYKDLKVKSKSALVRFLDVTKEVVQDPSTLSSDVFRQLKMVKDVLERWEISGFNRKLQMKPQKWNKEISEVDPSGLDMGSSPHTLTDDDLGLEQVRATELLVILKWGGDLTPLGRDQAETLGTRFRHEMYPDPHGGGVLRLHATYRHDLKIKASDEGRVMKTAAAFTKGLLELEGNLTPILASLVTVEEKNRQLLDKGGNDEIKDDMDRCKEHMATLLQTDAEMTDELIEKVAPCCPKAILNALEKVHNPQKCLRRMHELIESLCTQLDALGAKHAIQVEVEKERKVMVDQQAIAALSLMEDAHTPCTPCLLPPQVTMSAAEAMGTAEERT